MQVSLIITTYNRPEALAAVLESARLQTRLPDETIVVDDGSDEPTAAVVRPYERSALRVRRLWQPHDGFRPGRMRNWGIAESRSEYVVLIDGDMALERSFIADHLASAARGRFLQGVRLPLTAAATEAYLRSPIRVRPWHVLGVSKMKHVVRSPRLARWLAQRPHGRLTRVHSCNQSFWRADLLAVNGFDERFNGFGGEDRDLCSRLVSSGVLQQRLRFAALAYHLYHPPGVNWREVARWPYSSPWAERGLDVHLGALRRAA